MKSLFLIMFGIIVPGFLFSSFGQKWQSQTIDSYLPRAATVQIGDIDGDKDMDMVATSFRAGKVVWYDNNPFQPDWDLPYTIDDSLPGASGVQIADIDNDKDLDVVAAGNEVHDVVWYKNEGGTPIQWTRIVIDDAVLANVVHVTDIDSDGDPDVLVAAWDGYGIFLYENNNLTWSRHAIGYSDGAVCLESYDMDGDHDLDLVATSLLESKVYWFENDPPNHGWYRHAIDKLPEAFGLGVADLDNDGDPDVAATSLTWDDVVWYENNLPDLSWTKHIVDVNLDGARYLSTVDVDTDNNPDLVVTGHDADVVVWYKNDLPDDTVWTRNTIEDNLNGANYICAADMTGDDYPDLVVTAWFGNKVVWYKNPVVGIDPISGRLPTGYKLSKNYPNPFNPTTAIAYQLPKQSDVQIEIYNMLGQRVRTLLNDHQEPGEYKVVWDGRNDNGAQVSSGVYMYRMVAGDFVQAQKMILMK